MWIPAAPNDSIQHSMDTVFAAGERNHHISNTAYPIAHNQTWKPYKLKKSQHLESVSQAFSDIDHLTLYSHIPFCESRCYFCEYTVVDKSELDQTEIYMDYLGKELALYSQLLGRKTLHGFDIGGGTPSFVDAGLIDDHINQVVKSFDLGDGFEISIETTPKIACADYPKLHAYRQSGIERISMGIQVTQPDLLRALGREENGQNTIHKATENIRKAGFTQFNVDLMYGFSGQSVSSWEATLRYALLLNPEFITLYRMRYKLTRVSHQASNVYLSQIHEQAALAKAILFDAGYSANPGKNTYSRTNGTGTSAYLTRRVIQGAPYLGLGLGAQSYTNNSISYNSGAVGKNLNPYYKCLNQDQLPIQDFYNLPATQMMAKMVAVSFYFGEINLNYFLCKFGVTLENAYGPAVAFALRNGLMEYTCSKNGIELAKEKQPSMGIHNPDSLSLTKKGAQHFNGTIALFFAPSVQSYLISRAPDERLAGAFDKKRNTIPLSEMISP